MWMIEKGRGVRRWYLLYAVDAGEVSVRAVTDLCFETWGLRAPVQDVEELRVEIGEEHAW